LVIDGLHILGVLVGFHDFAMHFLDEVLFQDVVRINDFIRLGDAQVVLGILSSCVAHRPFYLTRIILISYSFLLYSYTTKFYPLVI
jgi:hypothetical protein